MNGNFPILGFGKELYIVEIMLLLGENSTLRQSKICNKKLSFTTRFGRYEKMRNTHQVAK